MNTFVNARPSHGRHVLGVLLVVTALLAASLMTRFSAAHATDYSGAMTSGYNGRCLDADLNTIGSNGTKVQLWDCNGQPQQKWTMSGDGTIHSGYNGRCLDADLNTIGSNGTKVQLWDCNGQPQQKWTMSGDGTIHSGYNGRCLDADLNTIKSNGTRVQLWDCNGQPQQKWSLNGKVEAAIKWYTDKIGNTYYDGQCELAVENAYGTSGRYASAMDNWRARLAAGQAHKASDSPYTAAPRGALVFWANTDRRGWGHVAISMGNGNIVTTSGPGGGIRIAPITYFWNQGPVGWAYEPW